MDSSARSLRLLSSMLLGNLLQMVESGAALKLTWARSGGLLEAQQNI